MHTCGPLRSCLARYDFSYWGLFMQLEPEGKQLREVCKSGRSPQLHEEKKEQKRAALARGAAVDGTTTVLLGANKKQTETGDARN